MAAKVRYYDRSRTTTDWTCKRKRYWGYEYLGRGITTSNTSLELFMGLTIHDALALIGRRAAAKEEVNIDEIALLAKKQLVDSLLSETEGEVEAINFANEQGSLVEGLLRGYYKHIWPKLLEQYPIIRMVEEECTYEHDGLVFMARPDLVMEDKEGNIVYIEFKSTSSKKEGWINSWNTAIQLHSSIRAIEGELGEKVTGVIVQGLYKGYESYGKQNSPFCYGYHRAGNPPFTTSETLYEYKAGYKRTPTWELPGGVKEWVEKMPEQVLADQFPQTPLIMVKDKLVDDFFKQAAMREYEIDLAMQMLDKVDEEQQEGVLNVAFPQTFSECTPSWGHPCQFRKLCHGYSQDPLAEGYELRVPHHRPELEQQEAA